MLKKASVGSNSTASPHFPGASVISGGSEVTVLEGELGAERKASAELQNIS